MAADSAAMLQAVCSEQKSDAESMRCTQGLLERLAVDPSGPSWLMTGSSRGHLTLWDMRFQLAVNSAQLAQVPSTSFASCMSSLYRDQMRHSAELVLRTCGRLGCFGFCPCCSGSELRGLAGLLRAMDAGSRAPVRCLSGCCCAGAPDRSDVASAVPACSPGAAGLLADNTSGVCGVWATRGWALGCGAEQVPPGDALALAFH